MAERRIGSPVKALAEVAARRSILEATESLLAERPLRDVSVEQILKESGISRKTFYFYFRSKQTVVAQLLEDALADIWSDAQLWIVGPSDLPGDGLRRGLAAAAATWSTHAALMRAVVEHWPSDPEIQETWLTFVGRFIDAFRDVIDAERDAGIAVVGPDSTHLATVMAWATERTFYLGTTGVDPRIPDMEAAVRAMTDVWCQTVYGATAAGLGAAPDSA